MDPKIAYWMGFLQGWLGKPFAYNLDDKSGRLQSTWLAAFNQGRIKFLEEQKPDRGVVTILIAE